MILLHIQLRLLLRPADEDLFPDLFERIHLPSGVARPVLVNGIFVQKHALRRHPSIGTSLTDLSYQLVLCGRLFVDVVVDDLMYILPDDESIVRLMPAV